MVKYLCDRCGEEINPFSAPQLKVWPDGMADVSPPLHRFDLCDTCYRALEDWFRAWKAEGAEDES